MERKIGEIFEYNGEWYQCLEDTNNCCDCNYYCDLYKVVGYCQIACTSGERIDNNSVYFKKLEKVGEPYEYFVQGSGIILLQEYILANPSYTCDDNKHVFVLYCQNGRVAIEIKQNKEDMEENNESADEISIRIANEFEAKLEKHFKEYMDKIDTSNLKPFDLKAAKAGKPVCTRDGRNVRIIAFDAKRKDEKNIIALVPSKDYPGFEDLIAYPNNGNYYGEHENDGNLMMMPEKKEGWIVIHKEAIYDKETAEKIAKETTANVIRIQKIEWEE